MMQYLSLNIRITGLTFMVAFFYGLFCCVITGAEPVKRVFYARFDVQTRGYQIEKSNLLLVPAENEFRAENFSTHIITGKAQRYANVNKKISIEKRAEHDALKNLLEKKGLKSVKSKSTTVNAEASTDTVMSYEGAVELPVRILSNGYDGSYKVYSVKMEVMFAPIAFPDKWETMRLKNKVKLFFRGLF